MSIKYIPQLNNENFVYPNYDLAEYDVNIIQDLKETSVTGTTSSFTALATSTILTVNFNYSWALNSAQPFISNGSLKILSIHVLVPGQNYYKPWRMMGSVLTTPTTQTTKSGSAGYSISATSLAIASFTSGTYYFEIRFIGAKAIYPVCQTVSITI